MLMRAVCPTTTINCYACKSGITPLAAKAQNPADGFMISCMAMKSATQDRQRMLDLMDSVGRQTNGEKHLQQIVTVCHCYCPQLTNDTRNLIGVV